MKDRQFGPAKALCVPKLDTQGSENASDSEPSSPLFTIEQEALYAKRFEEGYDLTDPSCLAWLKINYPGKLLMCLHRHLQYQGVVAFQIPIPLCLVKY